MEQGGEGRAKTMKKVLSGVNRSCSHQFLEQRGDGRLRQGEERASILFRGLQVSYVNELNSSFSLFNR